MLLDVSHLDRDMVLRRLPRIYRQFIDLAMLDITRTPMEVAPTAHYSMGGVWVPDAGTWVGTADGGPNATTLTAPPEPGSAV